MVAFLDGSLKETEERASLPRDWEFPELSRRLVQLRRLEFNFDDSAFGKFISTVTVLLIRLHIVRKAQSSIVVPIRRMNASNFSCGSHLSRSVCCPASDECRAISNFSMVDSDS